MSTKRVGTRSRAAADVPEETFAEVVRFIETARLRAFQAVNTELVGLYWQIGEYISGKLSAAEWGESVVDRLAEHLGRTVPGVQRLFGAKPVADAAVLRGLTGRPKTLTTGESFAMDAAGERHQARRSSIPKTGSN